MSHIVGYLFTLSIKFLIHMWNMGQSSHTVVALPSLDIGTQVSAFRDRGSLRPTSECRVPQPRWVERVGEHKGGRERGGRSPA
jgi:hypothetical protein